MMNTTEATNQAIRLVPDRTVICREDYQSTHHGDYRAEELRCTISVHPAIEGAGACQQFNGPSFSVCLAALTSTVSARSAA